MRMRLELGLMVDMEMVFRLLLRKVSQDFTTTKTNLWETALV